MRTLKILFAILCIAWSQYGIAQQSYDVQTLAQQSVILIKDSQAVVMIEGSESKYPVSKSPSEKQWKFKHQKDAEHFLRLLGVSDEEINEKWGHTFPNTSVAEKLITLASANPNGIVLNKFEEAGGMLPGEVGVSEQPTATITRTEGSNAIPWLWIAIVAVSGILIGYLLGKQMRGSNTVAEAAGPMHEDEHVKEFEAAVVAAPKDAGKITQVAKDKIAKLQADVKALKLKEKQQKAQLLSLNTQLTQQAQFHKSYFQQALKQYITPYNEAVEKGNKAEAIKLMIQIAAHFSSLAKHELELKQDYDSININNMLKNVDPASLQKIPVIDGTTPLDRLPHHIKVLMAIMKDNQVSHLQDTIVYGYRIQ